VNIIEACTDENLFGKCFRDISTWANWMTTLRAVFALPMSAEERVVFKQLSGRERPPEQPVEEAWIVAGR
jgi:hypothetical protein